MEGSSVNIASEYLHPNNLQPKTKFWYKTKRSQKDAEKLIEDAGRLEYHDNMNDLHILKIKNLRKNDSAEYAFRHERYEKFDSPGVTLVVTGSSLC